MELLADLDPPSPGVPPLSFVDYDDSAMRRLGYPALIPHGSVALILERIAPARPKAVVLDIDISRHWNPAQSPRLAEVLRKLAGSGAHIMLVRPPAGEISDLSQEGLRVPAFAPSPFDSIVDPNPRMQWTSGRTAVSDDEVVRRFPLLVQGCRGATPVVYPSPQLAALLWMRSPGTGLAKREFQRVAAASKPRCGDSPVSGTVPARLRFETGANALAINTDEAARIDFTLSWPVKGDQPFIAPAETLLQSRVETDLGWASGGIVVIGASATDRNDMHMTPLGRMPGSFIVINAIRSWLQFGPQESGGFWVGLVLVCGAVGLSAVLAVCALRLMPLGWRPQATAVMPAAMTVLLWLILILIGETSTAVALFFIQYVAIFIVASATRGAEPETAEATSDQGG